MTINHWLTHLFFLLLPCAILSAEEPAKPKPSATEEAIAAAEQACTKACASIEKADAPTAEVKALLEKLKEIQPPNDAQRKQVILIAYKMLRAMYKRLDPEGKSETIHKFDLAGVEYGEWILAMLDRLEKRDDQNMDIVEAETAKYLYRKRRPR